MDFFACYFIFPEGICIQSSELFNFFLFDVVTIIFFFCIIIIFFFSLFFMKISVIVIVRSDNQFLIVLFYFANSLLGFCDSSLSAVA